MSFDCKNKGVPIVNAEFTYKFADRLFGGMLISYMPLTKAEMAIIKKIIEKDTRKLKLNPMTTLVSIGYKF